MKSSCYSLAGLLGALASGLLVLGIGAGGSMTRVERSLAPRGALTRHARTSRLIARVPRGQVPTTLADRQLVTGAQPVGEVGKIATWGPPGAFPFDAEYNGDMPSENSDSAPTDREQTRQFVHAELFTATEGATYGDADEQAWLDLEATMQESVEGLTGGGGDRPDDAVATASNSLVAVTTVDLPLAELAGEPWEPLPFRVLGWDDEELAAKERGQESAFAVLQGVEVLAGEDLAGEDRAGESRVVEPKTRGEWLRQVGRALVTCGRWLEERAAPSERTPAPCQ